jgi:hypothetical protein
MAKLIAIAAIVALGYWYYQGPYQQSRLVSPEERAMENARAMERCVRQERSVSVGGAMAGAMTVGEDYEDRCADKLGMVQRDGQWVQQ